MTTPAITTLQRAQCFSDEFAEGKKVSGVEKADFLSCYIHYKDGSKQIIKGHIAVFINKGS